MIRKKINAFVKNPISLRKRLFLVAKHTTQKRSVDVF